MSNAISGIGAGSSMMYGMTGGGRMQRSDPTEMVETLFANIDTENKGYIEAADLQAAFDQLSTDGDSDTASVDEIFATLDSDGDGKLTSTEMSESMQTLSDTLGFLQGMGAMGGPGGPGGMPPPPPPAAEEDTGFTEEELTSQLSELQESGTLSDADTARAELLTSVLSQFDTADTNSDGRVDFKEAMAIEQSGQESDATASTTGSTATSDTTAATAGSDDTKALVMRTIMQLMQTYGAPQEAQNASSLLSLSA